MFGNSEYLQAMLDAGAKGFLLKNVNGNELIKAVDSVNRGFNFYSTEMVSVLTDKFLNKTKTKPSERIKLSNRELEVLQYICKGYTNAEIAKKMFLSQRTIDGHRAKIISKTDTKNTVNLVVYAIKNKLVDI